MKCMSISLGLFGCLKIKADTTIAKLVMKVGRVAIITRGRYAGKKVQHISTLEGRVIYLKIAAWQRKLQKIERKK